MILRGYLGTLFEGTVREGDDSGQPVCIRLVTRELLTDDDRDRIATSARVFEGERHASLVAFRDVIDGDQFAIVSDRFDGDGMRTLLRQLSVKRTLVGIGVALRIARDMLSGIEAMHERAAALAEAAGRGYGGLTPDSFVVDREGRTRLLEPGVECAVSRSEGWAKHSKRLGYDAPEIFDEGAPGASADVFTAAAITWEILLNKRLLPGTSFEVVARRWKSGDLPRADAQKRLGKDDTPKALADVLARGLELDPARRYQSAREMIDALAALDLPVAEPDEVATMVSSLAIRKPRSLRPPPGQVAGYVPRIGTMMGVGPKDRAIADAAKPVVEAAAKPAPPAEEPPAIEPPAEEPPAKEPPAPRAGKALPKRTLPKRRPPAPAGDEARRKPPPRRKPAPPDKEEIQELSVSDMTTHHSSKPPAQDDDADVDIPIDAASLPPAEAASDATSNDEDPGDEGTGDRPADDDAQPPAPPAAAEDDDARVIAALDPSDALRPKAAPADEGDGDGDDADDDDEDEDAAAAAPVPDPEPSAPRAAAADPPEPVAAAEPSSSKLPLVIGVVAAAAVLIIAVSFMGGDDPADAPATPTTAAKTTTQATPTTTTTEATTTSETTTEETTTSASAAEEEPDAGADDADDAGADEASAVAAKSPPPAPPNPGVVPRPRRPAPRPTPKPKPKTGFVPDDI